jgi:hypothetical protein
MFLLDRFLLDRFLLDKFLFDGFTMCARLAFPCFFFARFLLANLLASFMNNGGAGRTFDE